MSDRLPLTPSTAAVLGLLAALGLPRASRAAPTSPSATAAPATAAPGEAEYERAVQSMQAAQPGRALAEFERALSLLAPEHSLRTLALYGAGRAASRLATADAACKAVRFYQDFVSRPDAEADKRQRASSILPELAVQCARRLPAAVSASAAVVASNEPPIAPARATPNWRPWLGWSAVGLGGALGLVGGYYWSETFDAQDRAARTDIDRDTYDRAAADVNAGGRSAWLFTGLAGAFVAGGLTALLWPDASAGAPADRP